MNKDLTPEQQADVEARIKAFREDYMALVKTHDVDLVAYPHYSQKEDGSFATHVSVMPVNRKEFGIPSPIQPDADGIIKEE